MRNELKVWKSLSITGITLLLIAVFSILPYGCQQPSGPSPQASSPVSTQTGPGATESITITPESPSPTPEVTSTPSKTADLAPYTLSKGRRDPFVPFGSSVGEEAPPKPEQQVTEAPKSEVAKPKMPEIPQPVGMGQQTVTSVPVQVTGTFVSGGKNWAILTSSVGGGPSFMVTAGDRVGEYFVKSVDSCKVVLVWSNKEYVIKMQTFGPQGIPKGSPQGVEPEVKTLPAPEKPKNVEGQPQMMPPPGGPPAGGSAPGGGSGESAESK